MVGNLDIQRKLPQVGVVQAIYQGASWIPGRDFRQRGPRIWWRDYTSPIWPGSVVESPRKSWRTSLGGGTSELLSFQWFYLSKEQKVNLASIKFSANYNISEHKKINLSPTNFLDIKAQKIRTDNARIPHLPRSANAASDYEIGAETWPVT